MRAFVMPGGNQMGTGYYLLDNHQRVRQYNRTRRDGTKPSGVIDVHTFESFPDWVGEDTGVENAIRYLLNRSDYGSYHSACDSDSTIRLVPWQMEAFHDRFTNKHAVGISIATQAHKWPQAPREWRARAIRRAAREAARIADEMFDELGVDVPARWLTQAQAHARVPGFVRHGTSDPGRRSDPWPDGAPEGDLFLSEYREARTSGRYANDSTTTEEDDMTPQQAKQLSQLHAALVSGKDVPRVGKDGRPWPANLMAAVARLDNTLVKGVTAEWPKKLMASQAKTERDAAKIRGLEAAVTALASAQGLKGEEITAAVLAKIDEALDGLTVTLTTED